MPERAETAPTRAKKEASAAMVEKRQGNYTYE